MSLQAYLAEMVKLKTQMGAPPGFHYPCVEAYVMAKGRTYEAQPFTQEERDYVLSCVVRYGKRLPIKQCFSNSQLLLTQADRDKRFTYVEGYVSRGLIPILHGWLELNGKVLDVTLRQTPQGKGRLKDRVLGEWTDPREYFGVPFEWDAVVRRMCDTGMAGSLLDDYERAYPLLRKP